ncbi:hypothetical protein ACQWG3_24500, partial [Salmonella enterica subsp. enterica serovar Infantis]
YLSFGGGRKKFFSFFDYLFSPFGFFCVGFFLVGWGGGGVGLLFCGVFFFAVRVGAEGQRVVLFFCRVYRMV